MMELAVALRAIVCGEILLPPDRFETISRIAMDLMNPQWNLQAHVTLKDPLVQYFAKAFCRACIQAVPLTRENPARDLVWQGRVAAALAKDEALQNHARALLQCIRLRVTPEQSTVTPTSVTPPAKRDQAELHAKTKQFAEEFVRRREAQKARPANTNTPAPVSNLEQAPQAVSDAPPIASPPSSRQVRIFRNAVARAQSVSMPPILGLCSAAAMPDEMRPGLSQSIPS